MNEQLTRAQVRRVDERAINHYHIDGLVLMENAGRSAAAIIRDTYGPTGSALIIAGTGNNGGDGFVIARHLHNAGWQVRLLVVGDPSRMTPDAKANYRIVEAMDLPRSIASDLPSLRTVVESIRNDEIVVDALLGTGFTGQVRSPTAELIEAVNKAPRRGLVAVDVPSGLDCDTGAASNATIAADLTVTFVAEKVGFANMVAAPYVGKVSIADIGAPPEAIAEVLAEDS